MAHSVKVLSSHSVMEPVILKATTNAAASPADTAAGFFAGAAAFGAAAFGAAAAGLFFFFAGFFAAAGFFFFAGATFGFFRALNSAIFSSQPTQSAFASHCTAQRVR